MTKNILSLFLSSLLCVCLFACESAGGQSSFEPTYGGSDSSVAQSVSGGSADGDTHETAAVGYWREGNDFGCTWYWGDDEITAPEKSVVTEENDIVYPTVSQFMDASLTGGALFIPSDMLTGELDLTNTTDKILNVVAEYPYKNAYKSNYEFRTSLSDIPKSFSGGISVVGYVTLTDNSGNGKTFYSQKSVRNI